MLENIPKIHKSDDTDFLESNFLTFNISSNFDMTDWTCTIILCGLSKSFTDLTSPILVNYSHEETSKFIYGQHPLTIKITDANGKIKTVSNTIPVLITSEIVNSENDIININVLPNSTSTINLEVNSGGSGTYNHAQLFNLNYEQSGHTGFASTNDINNVQAQINEKQPIGNYATKEELENKQDIIEIKNSSETTLTIEPNKFYIFNEVVSLNIALATITDNTMYNEFMFQFTSGTSATTLILPATIKWAMEPTIEANKTYQCSILNNIGLLVGVYNV